MKIQKYLLLRIYFLHTLDQQFIIFVIFFKFCSSSLRLSKRGSVNYGWLLGKRLRVTSLNIKHYSLRKFYSLPPHFQFTSVQFSHSALSTLCDPMDCSIPGFRVHHQLLELAQTHVHWVQDAIQPSHPLSSPSPPAFNLAQHQGLFKWVSSSHQVAKLLGVSALASVLPVNIQDWFPLGLAGLISLQSKGLSRVSSNTTVQNHQFFSAQFSL